MVKNQRDVFRSSYNPYESKSTSKTCYSRIRYFKVPTDQRNANPAAFEPYLFSFGLYHAHHAVIPTAANHNIRDGIWSHSEGSIDSNDENDEDRIQVALAEKEYRDACNEFCNGYNDGDYLKLLTVRALLRNDTDLKDLVTSIRKHDAELRRLYIQMPPLSLNGISPSSLALHLALDAITIVASALHLEDQMDCPLIYPISRLSLSDAILLENQVPIFILQYAVEALQKLLPAQAPVGIASVHQSHQQLLELHLVLEWYRERASPFPNFTRGQPPPLSVLLKEPLLHYIYDYLTETDSDFSIPDRNPPLRPHETHAKNPSLPHIQLTVKVPSIFSPVLEDPSLPTASRLARCGVEFQACDAGFQGIEFFRKGAVLSIPRIAVSDNTVRSLHNLLAYEATSRYPAESSVISYVHFMDSLIDTEEDVRVLADAGVIRNVLGSHQELASMWNKLCISVSCRMTDKDSRIMAELEALAKKRWRRWWASFKEKYWEKQPWLIVSIVAAVILLVLTFLQAVYAIKDSGGK